METIRSKGKINIIDNIPRGKGSVVTKEFLYRVARGFVKYSSKYMSLVEESPFAFRERQLSSILAPTLAKFCDAFLMEIPTNRRDKRLDYDSHGWIDYWAYYRNIDFYIELKHSFISYRSCTITEVTKRRWRNANKQTKDCLHSLVKLDSSKGIVTLPIQVIPIYETVRFIEKAPSKNDVEALLKIQNQFHETLEPNVNWSCLWVIHEKLTKVSCVESDKSIQYFAGVLIIANILHLRENE